MTMTTTEQTETRTQRRRRRLTAEQRVAAQAFLVWVLRGARGKLPAAPDDATPAERHAYEVVPQVAALATAVIAGVVYLAMWAIGSLIAR